MVPWRHLNNRGKLMVLCVPLNMYIAILYATTGSYLAIIPVCVAAICGMSTYNKKYQIYNINEQQKTIDREE